MSAPGWPETLEAFADRLADQRAALEVGTAGEAGPFAPPPGLGPCPQALRRRAAELLQEAIELQAQLEMALAVTSREILVVRQLVADHERPTPARYVDRRI